MRFGPDDKLNITKMAISVRDKAENIVGKGLWRKYSSLFSLKVVKSRDCVIKCQPIDKVLEKSKVKAIADVKINRADKLEFVL